MAPTRAFLLLLAASLAAPLAAQARGSDGHELSIAGGIASPSLTTGIEGENPAGLVYVPHTLLQGSVSTGNDSWDPLTLGAGLYLGNGNVGGALGLTRSTTDNADFVAHVGLAAEISALNAALGVSAAHVLDSNGGWGVDAGLITKPDSDFRVGVTAFGVNDGVDAVAAGFATGVGSGATFALDGGWNPDSDAVVVKPGLGIQVSSIQLAVGYGFEVTDKKGGAHIPTDFSVGLGFKAAGLSFETYYNQLARWYIGVSAAL
jgi:hypothetical protein